MSRVTPDEVDEEMGPLVVARARTPIPAASEPLAILPGIVLFASASLVILACAWAALGCASPQQAAVAATNEALDLGLRLHIAIEATCPALYDAAETEADTARVAAICEPASRTYEALGAAHWAATVAIKTGDPVRIAQAGIEVARAIEAAGKTYETIGAAR